MGVMTSTQRKTSKPRGRELGLPFPGETGAHNAITDVAGVDVGCVTLIAGDGPLVMGKGPVRTGVTAILPRGRHTRMFPALPAATASTAMAK